MEIFPFTIQSGKFLGDDVVVAGTDVNRKSTCQVKIVDFVHDHSQVDVEPLTSRQRAMIRGEASLMGSCSAMELCGVPSLNKNYIAVAVNDGNKGYVSMLETRPSPKREDLYHIAPVQSFEQKPDEASHFNGLAYFSYHSHLAAVTEAGDVVVTDIATADDITRKRVDCAGAVAVRYTKSGMVVVLGQSNSGQVILWDPRSAASSDGISLQHYCRPLANCAQGLAIANRDSYLTCLETHPSNEYEFYCGTSTGSIVLWDIRKSDTSDIGHVYEFNRCRRNGEHEVTALAFKGIGRSPYVLSGAKDGSVACVNYHEDRHFSTTSFTKNDYRGDNGLRSSLEEVDIGFDQGTSAITSIQNHPQTNKVLITSKLGEVNLL